jgi:hypothetical protein
VTRAVERDRGGTGAERRQADEFFAMWRARHPHRRVSDATRWLHDQLLDAAYDVVPPRPARRRLAITTAGVPVVYSHKSSPGSGASPFRMLVEPGGTGVTVAEQVRLSRDLLARVLDRFGWQCAGARVDEVLGSLLPTDRQAFDGWHGGLGFGMEADAGGPELRLYCNVRHGELVSRWQRLTDAVAEFADEQAEAPFRELLDRAVPRAVPAGVALAIADGEVRALRLYAGLLDATADSAMAAAPPGYGSAGEGVGRMVDSYRSQFGELGTQGITLAYDFAIHDGTLLPSVARFKLDLWCEPANGLGGSRLLDWTIDLIEFLDLRPAGLRGFVGELNAAFHGSMFQYVSLGCGNGARELSAYLVPERSAAAGRDETAADGLGATRR